MTDDQRSIRGARGLFDGYQHLRTPTDADYAAVMQRGLVVLDTNTLLNLYRYTPRTRNTLLSVMAKIGDQLWVPDQVMVEFWRRRETAMRDYNSAARDFEKSTSDAKITVVEAIGVLGNRVGMDDEHKSSLVSLMNEAFDSLSKSVEEALRGEGVGRVSRDTERDVVLAELEKILRDRIGHPLEPSEYDSALKEARRRIEEKIPPGFKDAAKPDGHAEGDYLVWAQIIREASLRGADTLFITGDIKEDWWRRWGGIKDAGPRFELLDEFNVKVGQRFLMLQPADFLVKAGTALNVAVSRESVDVARQIDQALKSWPPPPLEEERRYEALVISALTTINGVEVMNIVENEDGRHMVRINFHSMKMAVVIRYMFQPRSYAHAIQDAGRAIGTTDVERVIIVSNVELHSERAFELQGLDGMVGFVVWRVRDDNSRLLRAFRRLRTPLMNVDK